MTLAFAPEGVLQLDPRTELELSLVEVHEIPSAEITDPAEAMFWAYRESVADGLGSLALLDADIETPHRPMFFGTQPYTASEVHRRRSAILRQKAMPFLNVAGGTYDEHFLRLYPY